MVGVGGELLHKKNSLVFITVITMYNSGSNIVTISDPIIRGPSITFMYVKFIIK